LKWGRKVPATIEAQLGSRAEAGLGMTKGHLEAPSPKDKKVVELGHRVGKGVTYRVCKEQLL
jgi:hypothetical protein